MIATVHNIVEEIPKFHAAFKNLYECISIFTFTNYIQTYICTSHKKKILIFSYIIFSPKKYVLLFWIMHPTTYSWVHYPKEKLFYQMSPYYLVCCYLSKNKFLEYPPQESMWETLYISTFLHFWKGQTFSIILIIDWSWIERWKLMCSSSCGPI